MPRWACAHSIEYGPAGFIQKPYRPQQLMAEIERCLGARPPSPGQARAS